MLRLHFNLTNTFQFNADLLKQRAEHAKHQYAIFAIVGKEEIEMKKKMNKEVKLERETKQNKKHNNIINQFYAWKCIGLM